MEHKYTNDGRKVLIVGKLNAEETIVQEIFVSESEQEIPSGENFVVKSLHNEPVKSWKEKRIAEITAELKLMNTTLEMAREKQYRAQQEAKAKLKQLKGLASNALAEHLEVAEMFVAGEITHVYMSQYGAEIQPFDKVLRHKDTYETEVKLLSLFGRSDGRLDWRIHQYPDGSGSGSKRFFPCRSYDEAVDLAQADYNVQVQEWRDEPDEKKKRHKLGCFGDSWDKIEGLVIADDVNKARADAAEKARIEKIAKLRNDIALLEGAQP